MRDVDIPISYLKECFDLRDDGTLIWRARPREHFATRQAFAMWNGHYPGTEAGCRTSASGYIRVTINCYRLVSAHRIVWAMTTGAWPAHEIDHVDGNGTNNQLSNLREAPDDSSQAQNRTRMKNNLSGVAGVGWNRGAWQARLQVNGMRLHLGRFKTKEAAYSAYLAAKKLHHAFQPTPRII